METTARNGDVDLLTPWKSLATTNSSAAASFGARVVVLSQFVGAALPELSTGQRREITRRFRQGVEDGMAYADDRVMPAEYHTS
ncbi:hypothetical protein FSO04_18795 [Paraburkholderia madseniana]|uniref:Uncharacterized protein n=1 Tax=Paraburkholderia madseniana TaxID=2599607 RepID=A0A6N6WEV2_9BURK|nr:hypothetical protein [Paraburkholderia madseniana]KAE8758438.1 hypothetical protein FSO04_18795 [Paraburkholderia madseniana]